MRETPTDPPPFAAPAPPGASGWLGLNWRVVFVLSGLAALGGLAGLPLALDLARTDPAIAAGLPETPAAYYLLGLSLALQNLAIYGLVVVTGLYLARRVGLGAPVLDALTEGQGLGIAHRQMLARAAAYGLLLGVGLAIIDRLLFLDALPAALAADASSLFNRLLSGLFFSGINEEIKWRLFLVSAFAFLFAGAWRDGARPARPAGIAAAIVAAALCYAAYHLPMASMLTELTAPVVTRTLVLNALAGIAFGILYARFGLEAAIAAHMASQLPLQLAPGLG